MKKNKKNTSGGKRQAAPIIHYRSKENYSNCNGQDSLWVCVKILLGVTSISEVWDQFGGSILLKKKKTTRRRPASNSEKQTKKLKKTKCESQSGLPASVYQKLWQGDQN